MRKMISFELGKEMEKDVCCLVVSVGQGKILSASILYHRATEALWRARAVTNFIYKM